MDTGASMNLVSDKVINRYHLQSLICQSSFKLVGVTGIPLQVLGILRDAPICINGTIFYVDLVVTSKMNEDCILGQNFFEKYKMILDFQNKTISNSTVIAQLCERPSKDKTLTLRCKENYLISNIKTISCCLFEGEIEITDHSGVYYFNVNSELRFLKDNITSDQGDPILVTNGQTDLALACDSEAEVWLPHGCILGTVLPAIRSANLVESSDASKDSIGVKKQYGWEDNDPRRIDMTVSALKILDNENLNDQEKEAAVKLISDFPDV